MIQRYVVGFLFSPDHKKVVLINKKRPRWQRGLLNGVGGKIEYGETPRQAMIREFNEETGVLLRTWRQIAATTDHKNYIVYFFSAVNESFHRVKTKTDEHVDIYDSHICGRGVVENLKWLIPLSVQKGKEDVVVY